MAPKNYSGQCWGIESLVGAGDVALVDVSATNVLSSTLCNYNCDSLA